jgi:hypothetical protein
LTVTPPLTVYDGFSDEDFFQAECSKIVSSSHFASSPPCALPPSCFFAPDFSVPSPPQPLELAFFSLLSFIAPNVTSKKYKDDLPQLVELVRGTA